MQNFVKKAHHQIDGAGMQILPLQLLSNDLILDRHFLYFYFNETKDATDRLKSAEP